MATPSGSAARNPTRGSEPGASPAARPAVRAKTRGPLIRPDELRPAPVALVAGAEGVLAERAIAALLTAARAEDPEVIVERIDAATYESGYLQLVTSPSLFGSGPVVIVEGVDATSEAFVADLIAYLRDPAPQASVVLRHGGGQRGKALLEAVRASGAPEVECAPLTKDDDKLAFVNDEVRRAGRRITPPAARALVDALGNDLRELVGAARHLAEIATLREGPDKDDPIDVEIVETWFGGRVEVTAFRVADAAIAGRADQALALLRHAVSTGADPVPLVAALALKVRTLAKVSDAGRGRAAELAPVLGMAPWQVDRARKDLVGWSEEGLARAVLAVADADAGVKGASRDPVYAVERAVLTIAAARG